MLWDMEVQKQSELVPVFFVVRKVRSLVSSPGNQLTKMEEHNNAWKLILRDKDFSLVVKLNHPKYRDTDNLFGVDMNLENDKSTLFDNITFF